MRRRQTEAVFKSSIPVPSETRMASEAAPLAPSYCPIFVDGRRSVAAMSDAICCNTASIERSGLSRYGLITVAPRWLLDMVLRLEYLISAAIQHSRDRGR